MFDKGEGNILSELFNCDSDTPIELLEAYTKNSLSKKAFFSTVASFIFQVLAINFLRATDGVKNMDNQ